MKRFFSLLFSCLAVLGLIFCGLAAQADETSAKSVVRKHKKSIEKDKTSKSGNPKDSKLTKEWNQETLVKSKKVKSASKVTGTKKPKAAKKSGKDKRTPNTYIVKKGPIKIVTALKGAFEAKEMTEIALKPQVWTNMTVQSSVKHGSRVKQGDILLKLTTDKINQRIADLRTELKLGKLSLIQAKERLRVAKAVSPLDLAVAIRSKKNADEDLKRFLKIDLPMSREYTKFNVKMQENQLAYQKEELRQLEKMYEEDDLTEETEEIILRRQRDTVKQIEFFLKYAKQMADRILNTELPRQKVAKKDLTARTSIATEQKKLTLPLLVKEEKLKLKKLKISQKRKKEKLKKLLADRAGMVVKATTDGIIYYGQCINGKWSGANAALARLRPGKNLSPNVVLMTIVKARPILFRVTIPEEKLYRVRPGIKGVVRPTGFPKLKLTAIVDEVNGIPSSDNSFLAKVTIATNEKSKAVMPGMSGKLELVSYKKKNALLVPAKAVKTDPLNEEKHYVKLVGKGGKPTKHPVEIGKRAGKNIEIVKGLSVGDKVLKNYSEDRN